MSSCLLPKPCSMARFFPRGMGWSMELTDVVSSLWAKACAPIREELATESPRRHASRCWPFPQTVLSVPLYGSRTSLHFSSKVTPSTRKDLPCPPGEADPPKGPLSVPCAPWPDPLPTPTAARSPCEGTGRGQMEGGAEMFESQIQRDGRGEEGLGEPSIPRPHPTMTQRPKERLDLLFPHLLWHPNRGRDEPQRKRIPCWLQLSQHC